MIFVFDMNGLAVDVEYSYEAAQNGGHKDPSWDESITIESVCVMQNGNFFDISPHLSEDTLKCIDDAIWDSIESERAEAAVERAMERVADYDMAA